MDKYKFDSDRALNIFLLLQAPLFPFIFLEYKGVKIGL